MLNLKPTENKWEYPHFNGSLYGMEEAAAILDVLKEGAPTNGKRVKQFEQEYSEFVGAKYGVATNSWGGAAQILGIALDIKKDDEFIIPAIAMSATANFFAREGAKIVFAEVYPDSLNIDVEKLESYITSKTKAIVVVHMCGQPADMDAIITIAKQHNLVVIQDAAHAPGALYKNRGLGSFGDFTLYSFHQAKNMCTLGEGGMIVLNDEGMAKKLKKIRGHGAGEYIGVSNRMTEVQAAAGLVQLKRLPHHTEIRRELAHYFNQSLKDIEGIHLPVESEHVYHVYHLYNVLLDEQKLGITKKRFIEQLWRKKRIMAISYSPTVNCIKAYQDLGHRSGECPIAEETAMQSLIFPIAPWYTFAEIDEMVAAVKQILA